MRNLLKNIILLLLFISSFSLVNAQECPYQVQCLNAGGDDIVRVFYSTGSTMPEEVTFVYAGDTYWDQEPVNESTAFQDFSLSFCNNPSTPSDINLNIELIINGESCQYIEGVLGGPGGGDDEIPCPDISECEGSTERFYLRFPESNGLLLNALSNGVTFYFDNYPCLNGTYFSSDWTSGSQYLYIYFDDFNDILPCAVQSPLHSFTMVLNYDIYETVCVIQDNFLCTGPNCEPNIPSEESCDEFLTEFGDGIIGYAQDYLDWDEDGCKQWGNSCSPNGIIKRVGQVGIGTDNIPSGYKLAVKGGEGAVPGNNGITTEQFMVCAYAWCDYVFEEGYKLMPLVQVEKYIKDNGHLHGFPSDSTIVNDGGFDLGEIVFKQQEKIEEAFLHIIDIDKTLSDLDSLLNGK